MNADKQFALYVVSFSDGKVPSRMECRKLAEGLIKEYLCSIDSVRLLFDDYGKPYLPDYSDLSISYSHSKTKLVVAVNPSDEAVGVDTEALARLDDIRQLRDYAFSKIENNILTDEDLVKAWCRKEAAVKRLGRGFRDANPSDFTVQLEDKSYTLYLRGSSIQTGNILDIVLDKDVIAICADKPIKSFELNYRG